MIFHALTFAESRGSCLNTRLQANYRNDPKFSDRYAWANSADPDQTAPLGAVWSGSALFAQTYLSKNLGSLRYSKVLVPGLWDKIDLIYKLPSFFFIKVSKME